MNVYVINLARCPDRREFMYKQLKALNITHEFFPATDAKNGDLLSLNYYDEDLAISKIGQVMTSGECGCFASHYRLWQHCVETDKPLVAMEDDILIKPDFEATLKHIEKHIEIRHFVRLFGLWDCKYDLVTKMSESKSLIRYRKGPIGTQCYAISPKGAEQLIKHSQKWIEPVDRYIDKFWLHGLQSYAVHPFPVQLPQVEMESTIDSGRAKIVKKSLQRWSKWKNTLMRLKCNLKYSLQGKLQ